MFAFGSSLLLTLLVNQWADELICENITNRTCDAKFKYTVNEQNKSIALLC